MSCCFNEDDYRDQQLNKHLAEQEMAEPVSNCCGEPIEENTDICSKCKEHCSEVELGEFMYDAHVAYEEDRSDEQRELERDRDDEQT